MDVSRGIKEEESRAGERVVGSSRNFQNADIVVPSFEFGNDFDVLDRDAVVLGLCLGFRLMGLAGFRWW